MKTRIVTTLLIILCLFHTHTESFSQQLRAAYPVQVTAFLPAPYSLNLADYCSGIKPKLLVTLLNRDLMEPNLQVRLHLSISAGNGIRIQTIDYNAYPGISLNPGVPYQLTLDDLCPYFQAENLNIQGALPGGRLPEGMIEICVSAVEVHTSRPVSQSGCARAWITLNRPPLLNLPANGVSIPFRDPMNILFQWTPRHQGLSNVEYEFSLREIMDTGVAVEGAFDYSPEVWSTVVRSTSLAYTAMQPPLLEGKRYGWQVRAVVRDGFQEQSLFENRGYSEIHAFTLSPGCNPPTGVSHHQETGHLVVEWTPPSGSLQSVVAYRSSTSGADWLVVKGNEGRANIFDMVFDHVYEYKVGTVCVDGSIVYGEIHTASLKDWRKDIKANCGVLPVIDLGNKAPLPVLRPGDMIMAGDFPVTVSRCEGSGGNFTGLGWTRLPLMASVKIAVQFTGIRVNTDYRMIGGYVETSYDKNESQVADGDRLWHGGDQTGQTITGAVESNVKANFSIPDGSVVIYDEGTGKLIVSDKEGKELGKITVPEKDKAIFTSGEPYTYTIQDKDEKIHTVTGDGKGNTTVTQAGSQGPALTAGSFSETAIADKKAIVEFSQGKDASYAFDTWKDYYKTISLIANKQKYEFLGSYAVPCKLIPPGKTDKVSVSISIIDKKINADSILFRTKGGYQATLVNGELTLTGGKANDAQDLYALYPDGKGKYLTLGKLKVLSYPEPTFNVVLVPVRDGNTGQTYSTDPTAVERALHEAYGPLGISWNVTMDEPFDYPSADLNSEGSDLFSRYTDGMKALNSAYKAAKGSLDSKAVYIFILRSGNIKGADLSGDMPRGKQFGYVFTEGGSLPRTIAHELGHGKFKLRHTFDGEYGGTAKATQGKTDNLMDYGQGTELAKWQWDEIFDPAILVNPFESDEDGMVKAVSDGIIVSYPATYVAPNKQLVKLPANTEVFYLCDYEDHLFKGYLYKFKVGSKIYTSKGKFINSGGDGYSFEGYYSGSEEYKTETKYVSVGDEVIVVNQYNNNSKRRLKLEKMKITTLSYSLFYEKGEGSGIIGEKDVAVSCGGSTSGDWNNLLASLDKYSSRLQSKWNIEINDGSGVVGKIENPGSKGKLVYEYKNGSWKVDVQLNESQIQKKGNPNYYKSGDLQAVELEIEAAINEKLSKFAPDKSGSSTITGTTTKPVATEDGGEFAFGEGLTWIEWPATLTDVGVSIYEEAALPDVYWDEDNEKHSTYPLHAPPLFCGVSDGVIDEVTSIPQLVKLGCQVVTDKEMALGLWESVKNITPSGIKDAAEGAVKEKWDQYTQMNHVTWHALGKDGVQVATMISGVGGISKVGDLGKAVKETGETIGKKARKLVVRSWDEAVTAVDDLLEYRIKRLKQLYPDAKIGYRGSLATGTKYSTGGPFDPNDWDVDAFIISDELALKFPKDVRFRNAKDVDNTIREIGEELEKSLKNVSGYRTEINKPVAFKVYTEAEFNSIVKIDGYKLFE